jgi:hypothetical protein
VRQYQDKKLGASLLRSDIQVLFWIAERVRRGGTRGKPIPSVARTLEAPDYKILNDQDPEK